MRLRRGTFVGLLVVATMLVGASAAQAALSGDVAMYSDSGDYIGQGMQHVYTAANATFTPQGSAGDLTVALSSNQGDSWTLQFAAPPGQTLQPGVYDGAGRADFRGAGQPGIDISGDGRGCSADTGRFEVKDIATDASGAIQRLWIVYEQHCEGAVPALFGEVRLGEPAADPEASASASLVRWPAHDFATPETTVPVQFLAAAPVTLSGASLTGADPSDFTIRSDACSGVALAAGQACNVYVRFVPTTPGLRTATLAVAASDGVTEEVPLEGWTDGGTTRLTMSSAPGDYIGAGQQYEFDPTNSVISASGTPDEIHFDIESGAYGYWSGDFAPPQGDILASGSTFTGAQRYPFQGPAPGLSIGGDGRGCNADTGQFQVLSATYAPSGQMQTFAVKFDQNCDGDSGDLTGEFDWRLGDTTPPAPWMGQSSPGSPTPPSGGTSPTASTSPASSASSATTSPSSPAPVSVATSPAPTQSLGIPASFGSHPTPARVIAALRVLDTRLSADSRRARVRTRTNLSHLRSDVAAALRLFASYHPSSHALAKDWAALINTFRGWQRALAREQARVDAVSLQTHARADGTLALRLLRRVERDVSIGIKRGV